MKFELVDIYPLKSQKNKKIIATVHIYAIDCELDIRGIIVNKNGNSIFFNFPHYKAIDEETQELVRYPHIRFTNENTHKEMMDFLHEKVKPEIIKKLKIKNGKKNDN